MSPEQQPATTDDEILHLRNENVGRLFLRAHRDFQERALQRLHAYGYQTLTLAHMDVIPYLDFKGTRIVTLAARAQMTKQSMGQLVQELEAQGIVERMPDPNDGRAVMIYFTDAGKQIINDTHRIKREIEAEYRAMLGDEGFDTLRSLLAAVLENVPADKIE